MDMNIGLEEKTNNQCFKLFTREKRENSITYNKYQVPYQPMVSFYNMKLRLGVVLIFSALGQVSAFVPVGSVATNSKLPRAVVTINYSTKLDFHSFEGKSSEQHVISLLKKCKSIGAAVVTASVLFLPVNQGAQVQIPSFIEPIVGIHPAYAAVTSLDEPDRKEEALRRSTVIDEAWTLVNKYYIDNTFNNQDWNEVRDKYESRLKVEKDGSYDDEEAMKLTTAMVKSLGDKYSRVLDRAGYSRIQKFDLIGKHNNDDIL